MARALPPAEANFLDWTKPLTEAAWMDYLVIGLTTETAVEGGSGTGAELRPRSAVPSSGAGLEKQLVLPFPLLD